MRRRTLASVRTTATEVAAQRFASISAALRFCLRRGLALARGTAVLVQHIAVLTVDVTHRSASRISCAGHSRRCDAQKHQSNHHTLHVLLNRFTAQRKLPYLYTLAQPAVIKLGF